MKKFAEYIRESQSKPPAKLFGLNVDWKKSSDATFEALFETTEDWDLLIRWLDEMPEMLFYDGIKGKKNEGSGDGDIEEVEEEFKSFVVKQK